MKHLKLFATEAAFEAAKNSLEKPYVCYAEDTGNLFYAKDNRHIIIMTSESNPSVMAICYAQGWTASSSKMTLAEAEAVTSIGTAFKSSSIGDFTEFQYFTGVTSCPNDAFKDSTVTKLYMPDSITSLGNFRNVSSLTDLKLSNNITSVPEFFAIPCALHIPDKLVNIGFSTNKNTSYSDITLSEANTSLILQDGIVYKVSDNTIQAQSYKKENLSVKSGVSAIPNFFCAGNTLITSLTLPSSVTSIGERFCRNATNLETITVEATTPPTLSNSYCLQNVSLTAIYVPSASVDTYKAASTWSSYASVIQAIPT